MDYIETFDVPGFTRLQIGKTEKGFSSWAGGCGIGTHPSIELARTRLFLYAKEQLTREADCMRVRITTVEETLAKLNNDVFNLGRFRVDK